VHAVTTRLAIADDAVAGDTIHEASGARAPVATERALYALAGMTEMPPELREGGDESLPRTGDAPARLLEPGDLRGVLHCHATYADGKATIAEMAAPARKRGWSDLGITDHSQAAFYAGGLKRDQVLAQHDEIDALNAMAGDFRLLEGIEADILADGALEHDDALLDQFDFVVGSVHSRFTMNQPTMTARMLRVPDDLRRLDLDWRLIPRARSLGVTIEIGPDAHSPVGLDNVAYGVGIARKGGSTAPEMLNARSVEDVLAFARVQRGGE
jgi:DNA polymerase (family 10)